MSFKSVISKLGKIGATTLMAGLKIGGGSIGSLAADTLGEIFNLDKSASDFTEKVMSRLDTPEGRRKALEADYNFKLKSQQQLNEHELAILNAEVLLYTQSQESYRAELEYSKSTGDKFVSHTRPMIIRDLFKLAKVMVYSLISAAILDVITDWVLMARCTEAEVEIVEGCWQFIKDRTSFSVRISLMYKDNWIWLSPLFGVFMTWFGGRTWEKKLGITKQRTTDEHTR